MQWSETERLDRLARLATPNARQRAVLDEIARMASRVFDVPIALVSLVGGQEQQFWGRCGLSLAGTPRAVSFCAHAITGSSVREVTDAQIDRRFWNNPLVTGAPFIRFYAGAPLVYERGLHLGALCIIDTAPRRLRPHDRMTLCDLAAASVAELRGLERLRIEAA